MKVFTSIAFNTWNNTSKLFCVASVFIIWLQCACASIAVEYLARIDPLPPPRPLPAEFGMEEGTVITSTIRGRNLMLVQDDSGISIIVTGSGPRYSSRDKGILKGIFKVNAVLDSVDIILSLLPSEYFSNSLLLSGHFPNPSDGTRDVIFLFDKVRQMNDLNLGNKGKQNVSKVNIALIKKLKDDVISLACHKNFEKVEYLLNIINKDDEEKTLNRAGNKLGIACKNALTELEPITKIAITAIMRGLQLLATEQVPYDDTTLMRNLNDAIKSLEHRIENEEGGICGIVKEFVSQSIQSVAKDIGDIHLCTAEQHYALAHFLHSEQLAYAWLIHKARRPKNYMYTQRGMCETCNPFIIRVFRNCPVNFYILSTYPAQRPGRDLDIEIDGTWRPDLSSSVTLEQKIKPIVLTARVKYPPIIRIRNFSQAPKAVTGQLATDPGLQCGIDAEKSYLRSLEKDGHMGMGKSAIASSSSCTVPSQDLFLHWIETQQQVLPLSRSAGISEPDNSSDKLGLSMPLRADQIMTIPPSTTSAGDSSSSPSTADHQAPKEVPRISSLASPALTESDTTSKRSDATVTSSSTQCEKDRTTDLEEESDASDKSLEGQQNSLEFH